MFSELESRLDLKEATDDFGVNRTDRLGFRLAEEEEEGLRVRLSAGDRDRGRLMIQVCLFVVDCEVEVCREDG